MSDSALRVTHLSPGEMSGRSVRVRNLTKVFRSRTGEVKALDGLTFDVSQGEFLSILGPSGCGKSTLLRLVSGLLPFETGDLQVQKAGDASPQHIGFIFQHPNLLPWRNVLENLMLTVEIHRLDKKRYYPRAHELLELTGLTDFQKHYGHELSGGMQQRVSLAAALMLNPSILLMDEPFGALDALTRDRLNVELLDLWSRGGQTVLFITHSIPEAIFLSDRILVLSPRPGRLLDTIRVDLPRPRSIRASKTDPRFGTYVARISELMGLG
ncbi:MAG: ABC transporter ATP-binding protein [Nitrospinota bacterium]